MTRKFIPFNCNFMSSWRVAFDEFAKQYCYSTVCLASTTFESIKEGIKMYLHFLQVDLDDVEGEYRLYKRYCTDCLSPPQNALDAIEFSKNYPLITELLKVGLIS